MKVEKKEKCICPNCGATMERSIDISANVHVCPECGCTIESGGQNFESTNVCPNCNQLLEGNECPYCGYDLGSDFD